MQFDSLNHFKSVFSHKFFVGPADKNYFLARFCKINGLHEEFYWQASQSIEKYLKAALILNGKSTVKYGHKLSEMYSDHLQIFSEYAFREFSKPEILNDDFWENDLVTSFVKKIETYGHPDIRYGLISWSNDTDDLFKFDQFCFEIRRLTIGLDWVIGHDWKDETLEPHYGKTYREYLSGNRKVQIRGFEVPRGSITSAGEELSDVWHVWNFAYPRDQSDLEKAAPSRIIPELGPMSNSYLYLLYRTLSKEKAVISDCTIKGTIWMLANIKLDPETKRTFQHLLERPKS